MRVLNLTITILCVLLAQSAFAGVNLKNGNFYISYTDIVVPGGGQKLEITRTYNSKATDVGWFGFGWGSDFETKLEVSADGSVVVHENGAGGKTRFTPKTSVDATAAAKSIIKAMKDKGSEMSGKAEEALLKRLVSNAEYRHAYALNFKVKSKLASGTILYSNQRGMQQVQVKKDGYKRIFSDGRFEKFDKGGKLVEIKHKNGYKIKLVYKKGKDGRLKTIKDSMAKQLYFEWYASGRVKSIWSAGDRKTLYKYKDKDLVFAKDIAGNVYGHSYQKNHYMNGIIYADKSFMKINYDPKTFFVTKVKDRNSEKTAYEYKSNPKKPDYHYWTLVSKKGFNGKKVTNKYEYEIKSKPDGSQYTYRIFTKINTITTETIYSECCSLPLKIARGKHVTTFDYNGDGLLTKKTSTRGDFVNIEYDKKLKKISKVVNNRGNTSFKYDRKGNLIKAWNKKRGVLLVYNRQGKITKMIDSNVKKKTKKTLAFKYNSLGKPVEIAILKVGKINVSYDNYGEIKKVHSKSGHRMALQVTQAFQNLLSIVKPAGVNLNM
jgi:YD repeat-containing protein